MDLETAFFNPYHDEKEFYCDEKEKIMRTAFLVFYGEEICQSLKYYVVHFCSGCNQDIGGKAMPVDYPHTCMKYGSMRDAFQDYGISAVSSVNQNNASRWKICRKWWDFIFDLPNYSSIRFGDAINFAEKYKDNCFMNIPKDWRIEFDTVIDNMYWVTQNSRLDTLLKRLSKW